MLRFVTRSCCLISAITILAGVFALPASAQSTIAISIFDREARAGELIRMDSLPFEVHIPAGALSSGSGILLHETTDAPEPPDGLRITSPLYRIRIVAPDGMPTPPQKPIFLRYRLNVFREVRRIPYAAQEGIWKPLAVHTFTAEKGVYTYRITAAEQAVAFFEPLAQEGLASWYRYKNCDCAASTVYPRGTMIRVWRLSEDENEEPVDVIINDFGPDAKRHPDRVIDLDLSVFKKIAKKGSGVIRVRTELIARRQNVTAAIVR